MEELDQKYGWEIAVGLIVVEEVVEVAEWESKDLLVQLVQEKQKKWLVEDG